MPKGPSIQRAIPKKNARTDIPVHRLLNRDFFATEAENVNLGDFAVHHRIDFFAIIWYLSQHGEQDIDFEPYPVEKNMIYLLSRNQVHALRGQKPKAKVILFSGEFFDRLDEEFRVPFLPFNNNGIRVSAEMLPIMESLFTLIKTENEGG
jgi:hypothetical protein